MRCEVHNLTTRGEYPCPACEALLLTDKVRELTLMIGALRESISDHNDCPCCGRVIGGRDKAELRLAELVELRRNARLKAARCAVDAAELRERQVALQPPCRVNPSPEDNDATVRREDELRARS